MKRIKLANFRQFYGKDNIINFSIDNKHNVTLIHAENGVGKTTILNSILWCFYNKFTSDFEHQTKIVNIDALAQGIYECEVEIEFIHEDKIYSATRFYDETTNKSTLELFVVDEGNYQPIRSDKQLLNSVIPEEMAEYFLFHGEGISQLQSKGNNFRNAIRDILGFNLATQSIEDMEVIKKKWQAQIYRINSEQTRLQKKYDELEHYEKELKEKQLNQKNISDKITDLQLSKKDLGEQILNCKIVDATQIKNGISKTENDKNRRVINLRQNEIKRQKLIQLYGWRVFGIELSEKSLDFIDTSTLTGKIPAPYDETLVNDIINSGHCICGRCVKIGTKEYDAIFNLLDRANTYELKNNLMKARSFAQVIGKEAKVFIDEFNEISNMINELKHEIADLDGKISNLNEQLDSIDDDKLKFLRSKERDVSIKLSHAETSYSILMRNIDDCNININKTRKELDKFPPQDHQSLKIKESIIFIQKLIDHCNKKMSDTEHNSILLIAQYVNEILNDFSRKDFSVKVNNNFNFEMVRNGGDVVAKSKGEKLLLNLAFVSALIKLAAQRSKANGKFLQPGTVAPFIIDAPFGELDETYRKATAHFLPDNSEQLVLLLSSSHWRGTVGEAIKNKVGKEYVLLSHKKSSQGSKPLDEININGTIINQSTYDHNFDGTSVLEIK